jgi:hypothetical protein
MDEREMMRRWVETWKQAGPELEAIRQEEIRHLDPWSTWRLWRTLSIRL